MVSEAPVTGGMDGMPLWKASWCQVSMLNRVGIKPKNSSHRLVAKGNTEVAV